jgi:peptidoglycan/xylan/chitin deacetylase (PgdA/CDA1 family)
MRAILTYHSIDPSGSVISLAPSVFERHVAWLAAGRVAVVSLTELLALRDERDAVAITFDDGFTNFRTEAWPRLRAHGLPVTLFAPTGHVGKTNDWAETPGGRMPSLPILGWPALSRLQEEGVTLGAHSRTHADLRSIDRAALEDEVAGSIEDLLRETGRRPEAFAYPYGYWNASAASVVRTACRCACTTALRLLRSRDDAHLLPRLDVFYLQGPGRLENFGSAGFREYIRVRSRVRTVGQWVRTKWHA